MITSIENGDRLVLNTPTKLPNASSFLWNKKMMIHVNCRGYATAQFMQPEPAKYAYAPNMQAKTFMQPEQSYYAHHPGRFFYIKNEATNSLFSTPYEPVRNALDDFQFSVGKSDIIWTIKKEGLEIEMKLSLPENEALEQWSFKIKNTSNKKQQLSIYPYFPVGYMSWMNQSAEFNEAINAIICSCITPYQKYNEYDTIKTFNDKTFLIANTKPTAWEANQHIFEGEGGLSSPSGIQQEKLSKTDARYETPTCVMQYQVSLAPEEEKEYLFLFGAAKTEKEIVEIRNRYFEAKDGFETNTNANKKYIAKGEGCLQVSTPDKEFDNFINHWLPRQIYYHGETNRLSTDPQTRNYLQDSLGMSYIKPKATRQVFLTALSQQHESGEMPDGILLYEGAELKYINQIPHTDHCVWVPICLKAYLDETNDYSILKEIIPFKGNQKKATVTEHIHLSMEWLLKNRDYRGLNFIEQGDWCDPMNMVGPKGKGVSSWLTLATAYALKVWSKICNNTNNQAYAEKFKTESINLNKAVNANFWNGKWYSRGITDDNITFGVPTDEEGRIFLNPQAWAMLSEAADGIKEKQLIDAVSKNLETPYGVELLAPAFTKMREDVGRVTQKHPGSAENGSVYNHAAAFYIFSLYSQNYSEKAYELLRKMIPGPNEADLLQRGQLPTFIPNYYRGAFNQFPRTAGRSSQLFNTGTVGWVYRSIIEQLFGLKGSEEGLEINPQLPEKWKKTTVIRKFRGATFNISIERSSEVTNTELTVDGIKINTTTIKNIQQGKNYTVVAKIIL